MTSQIVEEQIKLMENKLIEAGVAVRGNGVSLDKVTFIGTNLYVSEFFRSFASTLIERVGNELIGSDEQHESGSNTMDDEKVTRNDFRASQRTKLQKMKGKV